MDGTIDFGSVRLNTENSEPRCPCVLALDTSYSMSGPAIRELNAGLQAFAQDLEEDALARLRCEVAIITFGPVELTQDFVEASEFVAPNLTAANETPMGGAINLALDTLEARKELYRKLGLDHFRPWVFLLTDGAPTDGAIWQSAAQRVKEAERNKHCAFFTVGVEGANMDVLREISVREPLKLKGLRFKELFLWLSHSLTQVSSGETTQDVPLQMPYGWASVEGKTEEAPEKV